ncbi:MAG: acyl-CoA thioesterase [Eubacterium sp.]|nr:acyl-CoA thioesterase [Eubacterium sp.]
MTLPYRRKVNYYETDRMNIVHHSNYARYLEEARLDYMIQVGIAYDELEKKGIIIPVLELHDEYIRSVGFGDTIEVHIHLIKLTAVRFRMKYEIYNAGTGELVHKAETAHAFVNDKFTPLNLKKHFPEEYAVFEKCLEIDYNSEA